MPENRIVHDLKSAGNLGLALGGGGARGITHIGAIKVLEEFGIKPKAVSGTSFGAIVAAFHANGIPAIEMEKIIRKTGWHKVVDISLKGGLLKGKALGKVLAKHLPKRFEDLQTPLAVIATNIETGKRVVFTKGDLVIAIRASSCYPGIFEPVQINSNYYIDGGIVDNVPVSVLDIFGIDRSIAIDVNVPSDRYVINEADPGWFTRIKKKIGLQKAGLSFDILLKSVEIMLARQTQMNIATNYPDLYVHVDLPGIRMFNFDKYEEIMRAGENAMRAALLTGSGT